MVEIDEIHILTHARLAEAMHRLTGVLRSFAISVDTAAAMSASIPLHSPGLTYAMGGPMDDAVWTRIDDGPSQVALEPRTGFTPRDALRARAEAEEALNEAIGDGGIRFAAIQEAEAARRA